MANAMHHQKQETKSRGSRESRDEGKQNKTVAIRPQAM